MLPAGWNTYIGTAIQLLTGLTTLLSLLMGYHVEPAAVVGSYAVGSAIAASGQAKQSTLLQTAAVAQDTSVEKATAVLAAKT